MKLTFRTIYDQFFFFQKLVEILISISESYRTSSMWIGEKEFKIVFYNEKMILISYE